MEWNLCWYQSKLHFDGYKQDIEQNANTEIY
jgi:hypothetical protein